MALKPGRSLMDWIRVGKNSQDLAGTGGRLLEVTEEELAKHDKVTDAWLALRGMWIHVYLPLDIELIIDIVIYRHYLL